MLSWLKRIWSSPQQSTISAKVRDAEAKRFLANLRENELSVGAAFRRGDSVSTAPGQVTSVPAAIVTSEGHAKQGASRSSQLGFSDYAPTEDFATSMVIGAGTGNASAGYLAGSSLLGGMVGATLHDTTTHASTLENLPIN